MYAVCMHTDIACCAAMRAGGAFAGKGALVPLDRCQPTGDIDHGKPQSTKTESAKAELSEIANAPLDALRGSGLEGAFHAWSGRSGKRYIFTIASPHRLDHEAVRNAVIICASRERGGTRQALFVGEAKNIPQALLRSGEAIEVHYHLLAVTAQARRVMIEDLVGKA